MYAYTCTCTACISRLALCSQHIRTLYKIHWPDTVRFITDMHPRWPYGIHTCVMGGLLLYMHSRVDAWCLIQSPCCCMNPIYMYNNIIYVGLHALPSSWAPQLHTLYRWMQKSAHVYFSAPPGQLTREVNMHGGGDKMYECTIKISAHTPCTECIHNLCYYPVCSGYIHAPRELMLWIHGGGGRGSQSHMIGQRSSYCRSWFELYQPILI